MVLALPASRSCRKPGDCGSGHLSYGQDSLTLSLGKPPFDKMSDSDVLLEMLKCDTIAIGGQFDPIPDTLLPHIYALQSAGYTVGPTVLGFISVFS